MEQKAVYTTHDIAEILDISITMVYRLADEIPHIRIGKKWLFPKASFHRWMDAEANKSIERNSLQ